MLGRASAFVARNRGAVLRNGVRQALVRPWVRHRLWERFGKFAPATEPEKWLFIGGCYNSGTTILREVLSAHPDVASLPREGVELTSAFPDLEKNGWQRMWHRNAECSDLKDTDPMQLAREASRDWSFWWPRNKTVFLEKSIVHGAWMPILDQGFENCYFIGVIRNGFCAAEGICRRARPSGPAAELLGSSRYPISEAAAQWVFSNQRLLRDKGHVGRYLEIRYEDLVWDPEAVLRSMFRFIGVDDDEINMLDRRTVQIGKRTFVIRDDNPSSLARLTDAEREEYLSVAGDMMTALGYEVTTR